MKKVKFRELDGENQMVAVAQMVVFNHQKEYPTHTYWEDDDDLVTSIDEGFNPDSYFAFYVDDFNEVQTKIG